MFLAKKHLSRRTLLRGLALPCLDAMAPAQTRLEAPRSRPGRASKWCMARPAAPMRASAKSIVGVPRARARCSSFLIRWSRWRRCASTSRSSAARMPGAGGRRWPLAEEVGRIISRVQRGVPDGGASEADRGPISATRRFYIDQLYAQRQDTRLPVDSAFAGRKHRIERVLRVRL